VLIGGPAYLPFVSQIILPSERAQHSTAQTLVRELATAERDRPMEINTQGRPQAVSTDSVEFTSTPPSLETEMKVAPGAGKSSASPRPAAPALNSAQNKLTSPDPARPAIEVPQAEPLGPRTGPPPSVREAGTAERNKDTQLGARGNDARGNLTPTQPGAESSSRPTGAAQLPDVSQSVPAGPGYRSSAAAPAARAMPGTERDKAMQLKARGDSLLAQGNIGAARLFYVKAFDSGSAEAALAVGATYDSAELARLGVQGMGGDPAQARGWYEKALQLGAMEAKERLSRLGSSLVPD
jgi:hypothetical protein